MHCQYLVLGLCCAMAGLEMALSVALVLPMPISSLEAIALAVDSHIS